MLLAVLLTAMNGWMFWKGWQDFRDPKSKLKPDKAMFMRLFGGLMKALDEAEKAAEAGNPGVAKDKIATAFGMHRMLIDVAYEMGCFELHDSLKDEFYDRVSEVNKIICQKLEEGMR